MNEELKFVVNELNEMFNKEYNLISFNSLNQIELLQLLCDVLTFLNVAPEIQVNKNLDYSIIFVLDALNSVKYVPMHQITPAEFREGLATGKRTVVYPIIYWLLLNQEQVSKRAYLAKYIQKIDIPSEVFEDEEIQNTYTQYLKLITEFKNVYSTNQAEIKAANEVNEMSNDIVKMELDLKKINQRVEKQEEKVKQIPNREALMVNIINYRTEIVQNKKLDSQIKEHGNLQEGLKQKIKTIKEQLSHEKSNRPIQRDPLQQISEELQINKILMASQLPNDLKKAKWKLVLYNSVINELEPTSGELSVLNDEVIRLTATAKTLTEKKITVLITSDDKLGPFRNQVNKIADKKQQLSERIVNVKVQIEEINALINEKQKMLHLLVGGPVLHGEELKQYITKLRGLNSIYKEKKSDLQSLNAELGVLNRTLDVLKSLHLFTVEVLNKNETQVSLTANDFEDNDIKKRCKRLVKEINKNVIESSQMFEMLTSLKKSTQSSATTLLKAKGVFNQSTSFIAKECSDIEQKIKFSKNTLKSREEEWNVLHHRIEKGKKTLQLLIESESASDTKKTLKEKMRAEYEEVLSNKQLLEDELRLKIKWLEDDKEQFIISTEILNILKCKEFLMNN